MWTYVYADKLYHHGIKGQRWGIRRFQKKDGSLTPAGKKRYDDDGQSSNKSTHRSRLEAKYQTQGMTKQQAQEAAAKRIKTEKIIAVTAGVTVAAAAAYVVNKNIKDRADGIIKSGTTLQRITSDPAVDLDKAFYTTDHKGDKIKYKGLYGQHLASLGGDVNNVTLNVNKDVKIVSRQKAADTFADLYKNDSEFREAFKESNRSMYTHGMVPKRDRLIRKAAEQMTDKQLKKAGYDAFNIGLVNHTPEGNLAAKKFYDKLKSQGYDAVADINDRKYSGYKAKRATIVFNNADKISVSNVQKMTKDQIGSNMKKAVVRVVGPDVAKSVGIVAGANVAANKVNSVRVNNYKKEHPNTKLSDKEILTMLNS